MFVFSLQQAILSLSMSLAISLLATDVVCAANDEAIKSRLLSFTLFMNGVTTLAIVVIGIARVPRSRWRLYRPNTSSGKCTERQMYPPGRMAHVGYVLSGEFQSRYKKEEYEVSVRRVESCVNQTCTRELTSKGISLDDLPLANVSTTPAHNEKFNRDWSLYIPSPSE